MFEKDDRVAESKGSLRSIDFNFVFNMYSRYENISSVIDRKTVSFEYGLPAANGSV